MELAKNDKYSPPETIFQSLAEQMNTNDKICKMKITNKQTDRPGLIAIVLRVRSNECFSQLSCKIRYQSLVGAIKFTPSRVRRRPYWSTPALTQEHTVLNRINQSNNTVKHTQFGLPQPRVTEGWKSAHVSKVGVFEGIRFECW